MTDFIIKTLPYDLTSNVGLALVGQYLKRLNISAHADAKFPVGPGAVTQRDGIRGNPTWIEVGAAFPNPKRLKVIIWIEDKPRFPMVISGLLESKNFCITGLVTGYKGVAQIVLRDAGQLSLSQ
jgi:hypothetical protein